MELLTFKSVWGMEGTPEEQLRRIAAAGYSGVEAPIPPVEELGRWRELLARHNLQYIAQLQTEGDDHYRSFCEKLERAVALSPLLVVSHTGRDKMTHDEVWSLFEKVLAFEQGFAFPVAHETHRGRPTYNPWATCTLLEHFPQMRLVADFSHWCCVCESLLADMPEVMELPIRHTLHIHARVGFAGGPQVPHPAAPEYAAELAAHEAWWTAIAASLQAKGHSQMTVTAEYGPPPYMHTLPYTGVPVAGLWDTCLWATGRFRDMLAQGGFL